MGKEVPKSFRFCSTTTIGSFAGLCMSREFPKKYDSAAIGQVLKDLGCAIELHYLVFLNWL